MKTLRMASSCATAALLALAFLPATGTAATIVGGSDLLTPADAAQLETWLGQGPETLTNIFDKADGNTSEDFHAAADGMGATFSVIEVVGVVGGDQFDTPVLIGGYNPQSWNSSNTYNLTPLDVDRTAFVFNLTQGLKFDQRKDADTTNRGSFQTYNNASYGPTFGGGDLFDLGVFGNLTRGRSHLYSYGGDDDYDRSLALYPSSGGANVLKFSQIEVFTVSAVPEPETWALMLAGLGLLGVAVRRRA